MSNKTSGFKRAIGIVLGVITMLVLIALFVVLVMAPIPNIWVDKVAASDNAIDQTVSPTQSETYCPAPIGLADTGTYGDSAFQATVGNLSTQARYAAFGSVYSATVSAIGQKSSSDDVTLKDADSTDDSSVKTGAQKINQGARLINTRMLQAAAGTGTVGTIASWADDGDVRGISAASCVSTSLSQSFLLSDSTTGTTQQLIVSNLSTKPTTVDIAVWGSETAGKMALSTQSTLSVPAEGESSMELSAAVDGQHGLFVTVSSKETPIASVVRTVTMDGLTPKGSDFALPLPTASNASVAPSITAGDAVTAYLFAKADTSTGLSWITAKGLVPAKDATVTADKVTAIDLGEAPGGALGVMSTAEDAVSFSVKATRSGDSGQADFALVNAGEPSEFSGLALPDGVKASITLANTSNARRTVTLRAYDDAGASVTSKEITLDANAAQTIEAGNLSGDHGTAVVLMLEDSSKKVSWGARFSHDSLQDKDIAGLSVIDASTLMPATVHVWARNDSSIVK